MNENDLFYTVGKRICRLQPVNTACFVSPARDRHPLHLSARLTASRRLGLDTAVASDALVVRGDPNKIEELKDDADIQATRAAYLDESGNELILSDGILVSFHKGTSPEDKTAICKRHDCDVVEDDDEIWRLKVKGAASDAPLTIAQSLAAEPAISFAEPDAIQSINFASPGLPPDGLAKELWHLGQIAAAQAWTVTRGHPSIRVAVHDSGVDVGHPDLAGSLGPGWDFDNNDSNPTNLMNAHGTACAGLIAAKVGGGAVIGVAPECKIIPIRYTRKTTFQKLAKSLIWAASRSEILSCSWTSSPSNTLAQALARIARKGRGGRGVPILCASGNAFRSSLPYPASDVNTLAVGACTREGRKPGYSNTGRQLAFVCPSSGGSLSLTTTDVRGRHGYNKASDGHYCRAGDSTGFGMTSAATAIAAGVVALVISANPSLRLQEIKSILRGSCDRIGDAPGVYNSRGWSRLFGYGRLNAHKAVQAAQSA